MPKDPKKETKRKTESDSPRDGGVLAETCARLQMKNRVLERLLHLFSLLGQRGRLHEELLDSALDGIPSEAGSLMLVTSEEGELTIAAARGPVAAKVKGLKIQPGQGIAGTCAGDGRTFAISDVVDDSRHAKEISQALGFQPRSILAIPILRNGRVLGVIELINRKKSDTFPRHEIELVERVARTAGTLLELAEDRS